LEGTVLPVYAPWVLMRSAAELAASRHGSPADCAQVERRVRELVSEGEPPDSSVIELIGR